MFDDGKRFFFQPCFSRSGHRHCSVWGRSRTSLLIKRTADWILAREIRRKGDWA
jgi:hypothetical protein